METQRRQKDGLPENSISKPAECREAGLLIISDRLANIYFFLLLTRCLYFMLKKCNFQEVVL